MTPLEISKMALGSAESDLDYQRERLSLLQAKRGEVAALLEQAQKDVQDSTGTTSKKLVDSYGKLQAVQETFDQLFDEVEQQESAITGALEKLKYQEQLYQLIETDTEAQRQFIEWHRAVYSIIECFAVEARKALFAWNEMIALRERFMTTVDALVPGSRLHQLPLHWDAEREAQFTTNKDKLLQTLRERGADLRLMLHPYDGRSSLIDESPDSPLPSLGKFNSAVWQAISVLANEPLHPVNKQREVQDATAN